MKVWLKFGEKIRYQLVSLIQNLTWFCNPQNYEAQFETKFDNQPCKQHSKIAFIN